VAKFTIGLLVGILLMGLVYRYFPGGIGEAMLYLADMVASFFPSSR
jgi:hypothetical protein